MRYLLLALFAPGSFALILLGVRSLVHTARRMRLEDEDSERALRIQREYMVPSEAVEPPKGRRLEYPKAGVIDTRHRGFREEVRRG